jgi:hypothetical protein
LTTMNSIVIPLASNSNGSTQGAAKSFMILCLWYCSSYCLVEEGVRETFRLRLYLYRQD